MIYGIDLGTTNSIVCFNGKVLGGMVPSIVNFDTKEVGESQRENLKALRSFKTDISLNEIGKPSLNASALVLRKLVEVSGNAIKDVVISVPAYFSDNQRQATISAANKIGLNIRALINEPTAAAIYYSNAKQKLTLVYDLGGGTFDVSVIDSRGGHFDVQDTDGLKLGGDNLDQNIMKNLIRSANIKRHRVTPEILTKLKIMSEEAKIAIQKTKSDYTFNLDFIKEACDQTTYTLTTKTYEDIVKLTFSSTIRKTREVVARSIERGSRYSFLLVGGSTRCPYLKQYIEDEIGVITEVQDYNPDLIVAQGASLFAKLIEDGKAEESVSDILGKNLSIGLSDGTCQKLIAKDSKLPISESKMFTNHTYANNLSIKLYQGDSLISSNNELIGELIYKYDDFKEAESTMVNVTVTVTTDGTIRVSAKELLKSEVSIEIQRR